MSENIEAAKLRNKVIVAAGRPATWWWPAGVLPLGEEIAAPRSAAVAAGTRPWAGMVRPMGYHWAAPADPEV